MSPETKILGGKIELLKWISLAIFFISMKLFYIENFVYTFKDDYTNNLRSGTYYRQL
jgi:hypothetical protein